MNALNTCSQNFQHGVLPILGILILCFLSTGAIPAVAKQPLFDAYRRIIVLDPGHGGRKSGARGADGTAEKTVALELAQLIAAELQRDYKVTLTRTDDYHVDLDNRTALANHLKADVFVSLHTGGSFVYRTAGTIIYYYQNVAESSAIWREAGLQGKNKNTSNPMAPCPKQLSGKQPDSGPYDKFTPQHLKSIKNIRIQGAPLAVLQGAHMPAILIEAGYLTNPVEEKNLRNNRFLAECGRRNQQGNRGFFIPDRSNE